MGGRGQIKKNQSRSQITSSSVSESVVVSVGVGLSILVSDGPLVRPEQNLGPSFQLALEITKPQDEYYYYTYGHI